MTVRDMARTGLEHLSATRFARRVVRPASHRGTVPPAMWRRLPAPDRFSVEVLGGVFEYANGPGDLNARSLYWRGLHGFEPRATKAAMALFPHCSELVDVGANTGIYTLAALAANPRLRVTAYEPTERFRSALLTNLRLNGWEGRVTVSERAVDARTGTSTFLIPAGSSPYSARLSEADYRPSEAIVREVVVDTVALDDRAQPDGIDLLKIDVEGAELQVLRGATRSIAATAPSILFECHPEGPVDELDDHLRRAGYCIIHLMESGPVVTPHMVPTQVRRDNNFLAVRREAHWSAFRPQLES